MITDSIFNNKQIDWIVIIIESIMIDFKGW